MSKETKLPRDDEPCNEACGPGCPNRQSQHRAAETASPQATPAAPDRATAPEGEAWGYAYRHKPSNSLSANHGNPDEFLRHNPSCEFVSWLYASPQVQGGEAVAWQCRHRSSEPHEPWWNIPRETYEAQRSAALWSDVFEYRALAALPPPPAEGEAN